MTGKQKRPEDAEHPRETHGYVPDINKDIEFLKEMKAEFRKGVDNHDVTRMEKVENMIEDWLDQLICVKAEGA